MPVTPSSLLNNSSGGVSVGVSGHTAADQWARSRWLPQSGRLMEQQDWAGPHQEPGTEDQRCSETIFSPINFPRPLKLMLWLLHDARSGGKNRCLTDLLRLFTELDAACLLSFGLRCSKQEEPAENWVLLTMWRLCNMTHSVRKNQFQTMECAWHSSNCWYHFYIFNYSQGWKNNSSELKQGRFSAYC